MIIQNSITKFELQSDLTNAVDKWKEFIPTNCATWKQFKAHFGKEIKKVKWGQGTLKHVGITNTVWEQVEKNQVLAENILAQQK